MPRSAALRWLHAISLQLIGSVHEWRCALAARRHPDGDAVERGADALVGRRVRELRQARGLSASTVAARAGITAAYLSRLENDRLSPTVSTLTRVLQAIGVSAGQLFAADATDGPVVRAGERHRVDSRGVADYLVTPEGAQRLRVLETVIAPDAASGNESYTHAGDEECVLVLEGSLRIWLEGKAHDLGVGDSITFACRKSHRWANVTRETARVLWVITPASAR